MSQVYLAEHRGSTNWGDRKSNQINTNQIILKDGHKCWPKWRSHPVAESANCIKRHLSFRVMQLCFVTSCRFNSPVFNVTSLFESCNYALSRHATSSQLVKSCTRSLTPGHQVTNTAFYATSSKTTWQIFECHLDSKLEPPILCHTNSYEVVTSCHAIEVAFYVTWGKVLAV